MVGGAKAGMPDRLLIQFTQYLDGIGINQIFRAKVGI